jgi:hypothetical protein
MKKISEVNMNLACLLIRKARKFIIGFKRLGLPKEKAEVLSFTQTPVDTQQRQTFLGFV